MAIGASRPLIVRPFLARALGLTLVGATLGLGAAAGGARAIGDLLYGIPATDVVSFSLALAAVFGAALLASFIPAWRAARIDPLAALRHQ
jgi:ABC-type antimicrobial peptide transport system permease subunit